MHVVLKGKDVANGNVVAVWNRSPITCLFCLTWTAARGVTRRRAVWQRAIRAAGGRLL